MSISAEIYGNPTFLDPIRVLSVGSHPVHSLLIQSDPVRVLSIQSDLIQILLTALTAVDTFICHQRGTKNTSSRQDACHMKTL